MSRAIRMLQASFMFGMGLFALGCSDATDTQALRPLLGWELPVDESGAADFLLDFGEVPVGTRSGWALPIANGGAAPLHVIGGSLDLPFSSPWAGQPHRLGVGERGELVVAFAPTQLREEEEETIWSVETNEGGAPHRVRLVGRGVAPILDCSPEEVDFGQVVREGVRSVAVVCTNPLDTAILVASAEFRGSFAASYSLDGEVEEDWVVPAREAITFEIAFRARVPGRNNSRLVLRDSSSRFLASVELRAQTIESALRLDPPDCLDFGYVEEGGSVTRSIVVSNVGLADLQILGGKIVGEEPPQFSARLEVPAQLPGGGDEALEIAVEFHPSEAGRHWAHLEIATSDLRDGTRTVMACVTGIGGGPRLHCEEEAIDFGLVAIGAPMLRQLRCSNSDIPREGFSVDPLIIEELRTSDEGFEAAIVDEEGTVTGPLPEGYGPGESFLVQVTFDPGAEGSIEGSLAIESNSSSGSQNIRLSGEAVDLPPCDFSLRPASLHFGTVDRGVEATRSFSIINHQETACFVSGLQLAAGSHPAFSLVPVEHLVLDGLGVFEVPVRFRPTAYEDDLSGAVRFQISNGARRDQQVMLHGSAAFPCLVARPKPLEFGRMGVECHGADQILTLENVCGSPIHIEAVEMENSVDADSFALRGRPEELPFTLGPSERVEVSLRIRPTRLGSLSASLEVEASEASGPAQTFFFQLEGEGTTDLHQTERFIQPERTKVDLLFVMENTFPTTNYQVPLRSRISQFIDYAISQDVDFHIAAISTGASANAGCLDGGNDGGRFLPINADAFVPPLPRILNRSVPNLVSALERNLSPNNCHGAPAPFEAMLQALSPPLINEVRDSRPGMSGNPEWNDGNAGFLREDASLAIVALSLQMDQSLYWGRSPEQYTALIQQVKGPAMRGLTKIHAITTPPSGDPSPSCGPSRYRGDRLLTGVELTGGTWFDICTPAADEAAWDAGIAKIAAEIFSVPASFPLRTFPAGTGMEGEVRPEDLEVTIDGAPIPHQDQGIPVWTYDPASNAVAFDRMNNPRPGSEISVGYRVACLAD